ncbi:glucan endo-1,3-beta-glucosidase-like protein 2-like [Trifolium pratense]|uniref:Glucan endo-1,3-beta-glucosidase-like protein 2-like n=1 Tax=Trifolium pratense TaxID=57577 RepID=A0A2K3P156_TRIPR|nr:glucan endo-1,3-beta-glucosidase-like protein 2-like [Trifolium pratense]
MNARGLGTAIRLREDSPYEFSSTQLDSIPVVNPTTPGTGNPYPTINPTSPQPPDTSTGQTPPTPDTSSPTNPYSNPPASTNPYSNPTSPTNPYSTPTSPTVTPTTPTTTTPTSPTGGSSGGGGGGGGGQWCVASQSAAETTLKVALDYACGYGADCSQIQQGGVCFDPDTLRDHASYAFNDYYQKNPAPTSCVFGGVASLTNKDPSHGNCHFSSSKTSISPPTYVSPPNSPSPPTTMTPPSTTTMTPPSFMTPPSMTMPDPDGGSSSVYGSPPGGSPNIATSTSYSILLLLTTGLCATLHVHNYI